MINAVILEMYPAPRAIIAHGAECMYAYQFWAPQATVISVMGAEDIGDLPDQIESNLAKRIACELSNAFNEDYRWFCVGYIGLGVLGNPMLRSFYRFSADQIQAAWTKFYKMLVEGERARLQQGAWK
ncbi:MAG TPA: hypothetical protein VMW58_11445 [Anaerolineae bacterium]|nr:hypothetical protein [Anaerolineae bacterium]